MSGNSIYGYNAIIREKELKGITRLKKIELIEKNNIHKWVEKIQKLMSDKDFYIEMSRKAKEWVKNNYSEDDIINKSKNLIKDTIREFVSQR